MLSIFVCYKVFLESNKYNLFEGVIDMLRTSLLNGLQHFPILLAVLKFF